MGEMLLRRAPSWAGLTGAVLLGVALLAGTARTMLAAHAANRAQSQFGIGSEADLSALRRSANLRPDLAPYHLQMAEALEAADPEAALRQAQQAARLDPGNWRNWYQVSLLQYQLGNGAAALAALHRGAGVNTGYEAHLELAQLELLQGDDSGMWRDLARAWTVVAPEDVANLVGATLRASGFTADRLLALEPANAAVRAASIGSLIQAHRDELAGRLWLATRCPAEERQSCRGAAMTLVSDMTKAAYRNQDGGATLATAVRVWALGVKERYLSAPPPHPDGSTDAVFAAPGLEEFTLPWVGPRWSWASTADAGVARTRRPGVEVTLSGFEPDEVVLATQYVAVQPKRRYRLTFADCGQAGSGLVAAVRTPRGSLVAMRGQRACLPEAVATEIPAGITTVELDLIYRRKEGSPPASGSAQVLQLGLEPIP